MKFYLVFFILSFPGLLNGLTIQNILVDPQDLQGFTPAPPSHNEHAKLARYVVHYSDWASMATISARDPIKGFPFSNVFSISDGSTRLLASGIPYFYFTDMEMSVHDIHANNQISLAMTLAQSDYCSRQGLDPQDPPCARVILSGTTSRLHAGSEEEDFAKEAVFSRHPNMKDYPKDHTFYFAKMNIEHVCLLAWFGGATHVPLEDYFNATLT